MSGPTLGAPERSTPQNHDDSFQTQFEHYKERVSAMEENYDKLKNDNATIFQLLNELRDKCFAIELRVDS